MNGGWVTKERLLLLTELILLTRERYIERIVGQITVTPFNFKRSKTWENVMKLMSVPNSY